MTVVTDNFNRSNGALGANWTMYTAGALLVSSNHCVNETTDSSEGAYYTGASFANDQYVQAALGNVAAGIYFSLVLRGSGETGSRNLYEVTLGGTNEYYITRVLAGSGTDIRTGTATFTTGSILRGEAEGTTIRLKIDGTLIDSITDANITSGSPGIEMFSPATGQYFDDFEAGDLSSGDILLAQCLS